MFSIGKVDFNGSFSDGSSSAGSYTGVVGSALTGLKMVPVYGQALALVEGIIGKSTINSTLGALFAKDGGIKCWGSSWTPSKAEREVPAHAQYVITAFKKALNVTPDKLEASLNTFFKSGWKAGQLYPSKAYWWLNSGSARDCTKRGLETYVMGMDGVLSECLRAAKKAAESAGFRVVDTYKSTIIVEDEKGQKASHRVNQVKVVFPPKPKTPVAPVLKTATANRKKSSSIFPVAVLAAGAFFILKKKKR
jgi:hypothetical protein